MHLRFKGIDSTTKAEKDTGIDEAEKKEQEKKKESVKYGWGKIR